MLVETRVPVETVEAAVSNFSQYLTECGFYFANIKDPNKTLYGETVPKSVKNKKIKDPDKTEKENNAPPKVKAADPGSKFANYLQIVNAIQ